MRFSLIFAVLISIFSINLLLENYNLKLELHKLKKDNDICFTRLNLLYKNYSNLENEFKEFSKKYLICFNEKENLLKNLTNCLEEKNILEKDFKILKNELVNNDIKNFLKYIYTYCSQLERYIDYCLNDGLNYPCLILKLKNLGFKYRKDLGDEIENICDFLNRKGGDCEDYSAFFVGLILYLKKNGIKNIIFAKKGEGKFLLYKSSNIYYYLPNATKFIVNLDEYKYYGIICYKINVTTGHCVGFLSKHYVNPTNLPDLYIEPQTGFLVNVTKPYLLITNNNIYYRIWNIWK